VKFNKHDDELLLSFKQETFFQLMAAYPL